MEGQSAERAGAEAAPVAHKAEFYLFNGRHAPGLFVAGVVGAAVGQGIYIVHLLGGQGLLGRVLHHKFPAVRLGQALGGKGIAVAILDLEALSIATPIVFQLFVGG